jgi:hypothetical protein
MVSFPSFSKYMVIAIGLASLPALGAPPDRVANIWGGVAHEPDPSLVSTQERAAGIAPSLERERAIDDEVEAEAQNLLRSEGITPKSPNTAHPGRVITR